MQEMREHCKVDNMFSNPKLRLHGSVAGTKFADNALWIQRNRIAAKNIGFEEMKCPNEFLLHKNVTDCFVKSRRSGTTCSFVLPYEANWG